MCEKYRCDSCGVEKDILSLNVVCRYDIYNNKYGYLFPRFEAVAWDCYCNECLDNYLEDEIVVRCSDCGRLVYPGDSYKDIKGEWHCEKCHSEHLHYDEYSARDLRRIAKSNAWQLRAQWIGYEIRELVEKQKQKQKERVRY